MAIDQTNVALDIASRSVQAAGDFMDALEVLEEELEHGLRAGLNMTDYDSELSESGELKHVDGAVFNKLMATAVPDIRAYLEATSTGGDTYEALFYKVKR